MTEKSPTAARDSSSDQLDRLSAIEPGSFISLYLDMRPDHNGQRHTVETFLKNSFDEQTRSLTGETRAAFDQLHQRIRQYLSEQALTSHESPGGVSHPRPVICSRPLRSMRLSSGRPCMSARYHICIHWRGLNDQYPRYAALFSIQTAPDLYVFALGARTRHEAVTNEKTRRTKMGGWSQARYQRRADNFHRQHMKEVVDL
jgi:hypothetical protein